MKHMLPKFVLCGITLNKLKEPDMKKAISDCFFNAGWLEIASLTETYEKAKVKFPKLY